MTSNLIGWPSASGAEQWLGPLRNGAVEIVGRGVVSPAHGGGALPSVVVRDYTTGNLGDITGKGAGAGLRAARAVGVGDDAAFQRAARTEEFEARSAWVAELVAGESELGRVLLLLAGGREFAAGLGVRIGGNGMAARAARYIVARRGRMPSETSLEDAAAAAVLELVRQVHVWEYVLGLDTLPPARFTGRDLSAVDAAIRCHLCGCAWRAAFRSLDGDASAESGATAGRQAGEQAFGTPLALEAGQLQAARSSLEAWARGECLIEDTTEARTRRAVSSWLWRSLVPARAAGANAQRARACAIQRARFLIRLVHGASWADAARLAGFADGGAASKVLAARHTWAALGRAAAADGGGHPTAAALRRTWLGAARAEVKARRAARPFLRTTAARGARRKIALGLVTPGGAVLMRDKREIVAWGPMRVAPRVAYYAGDMAPRVSRKVRALAVDIGAAARRALDAREAAARVTSGARARLVAFRTRAAHDWEIASRGLRRGFMQ